MSRSLGSVVGTPSYGDTQLPEVAEQSEAWTMLLEGSITPSVPTKHTRTRSHHEPEQLGEQPLSISLTESQSVLTLPGIAFARD